MSHPDVLGQRLDCGRQRVAQLRLEAALDHGEALMMMRRPG
eukprot:SAG31_NODE_184_length_20985_cov_28.867567_17_plen_41_part_00